MQEPTYKLEELPDSGTRDDDKIDLSNLPDQKLTPRTVTPSVPGNIDLYKQPSIPNPKTGGTSTVYSRSFNFDGKEVLLPSVTPDGRFLGTDREIEDEYRRTGRHLGMFNTPEEATAYGEQLHKDYEAGKYKAPSKLIPRTATASSNEPPLLRALKSGYEKLVSPLLPEAEATGSPEHYIGGDIPIIRNIWPGGIRVPKLGELYNEIVRPMSSPLGLAAEGTGLALKARARLKSPSSTEPTSKSDIFNNVPDLTGATRMTGERVRDLLGVEPKEAILRGWIIKDEEGLGGYRLIQNNPKLAELLKEPKKPRVKLTSEGNYESLDVPGVVYDATGKVIAQPETNLAPIEKISIALQEAKPLRGKQEELYTAERGKRLSKMEAVKSTGEAGFKERSAALKGEYPKVQFESIRPQLEQADVDDLMKQIWDDKRLFSFEKHRAQVGMAKLLGEYGGHVPQENEILLLERVFGKEFGSAVRQKLPEIDKLRGVVSEAVNLPRALQASMDLSAPFRQGIGLIHKKEWWTSWDDMVKSFGSQRAFDSVQESIRMKPTFELSQEAGLKLTDLTSLSNREEQFMSNWAERIPGIGHGVRASNRAYVGFLNKLRSDTFDSLAKNVIDAGLDPKKNLLAFRELANFVNTATGRGSLGKLEQHAVLLNNLLFSPRLIASRVQMMNPLTYVNASPSIRKEYLKSLFAIATVGTTLTTLGKLAGGEVETDPTSADFNKLKIGNTRLDPNGGFQQYIVAASKLLTGEQKSTTTGKVTDLTAGKFGQQNRKDIIERFGRSKANPVLGFAYDLLKGKDFAGQPIDVKTETAKLFVPMLIQDVYNLANDDPSLLPFIAPAAATGFGVQTYSGNSNRRLKPLIGR